VKSVVQRGASKQQQQHVIVSNKETTVKGLLMLEDSLSTDGLRPIAVSTQTPNTRHVDLLSSAMGLLSNQ
jgi:hypothetical protein